MLYLKRKYNEIPVEGGLSRRVWSFITIISNQFLSVFKEANFLVVFKFSRPSGLREGLLRGGLLQPAVDRAGDWALLHIN